MKFNGKLTFALAGVGERYVWCFCTQLQLQLLCIAIVIYENIYLQAINSQNLYVAKNNVYRLWIQTAANTNVITTYKICKEERSAKIPCGISSIMLFDNFLQQTKNRNLH